MNKYKVILVSEFKSEINNVCCSTLIDYVNAASLPEAVQEASKLVVAINANTDVAYRVEYIERMCCSCNNESEDKVID